jgi:hypothetical protein
VAQSLLVTVSLIRLKLLDKVGSQANKLAHTLLQLPMVAVLCRFPSHIKKQKLVLKEFAQMGGVCVLGVAHVVNLSSNTSSETLGEY